MALDYSDFDNENEIYKGYNTFHPSLDTEAIEYDEKFQKALLTSSYGKRSIRTAKVPGTSQTSRLVATKAGAGGQWGQSLVPPASRMGSTLSHSVSSGMGSALSRSVASPSSGVVLPSSRMGSTWGRSGVPSTPGGSAWGRMPPSASRMGTAATKEKPVYRPMTAIRGAGYTAADQRDSGDLQIEAKTATSKLERKDENDPQVRVKLLEDKTKELVEDSINASNNGDSRQALEKAKEASAKERAYVRLRDQVNQQNAEVSPNPDLSFWVLLNLAVCYTNMEMYGEATNTYQLIIKNRAFTNAGRLKTNMGNIFFKQGKYHKAIKLYRMALDQVAPSQKDMKVKIMKNIALAFWNLGQVTDAISTYEYIMTEKADEQAAFYLCLCHSVIGDKEKMQKSFTKLLEVAYDYTNDDDKYKSLYADDPNAALLNIIRNDPLSQIEKQKKHDSQTMILAAAKIIAPHIAETFSEGYKWCAENMKKSAYADLANDLEISKAIAYLRRRDYDQAIELLSNFEFTETKVATHAATNLSSIYYLGGDTEQAEKYADRAIVANRFNTGGLISKANVSVKKEEFEKGVAFYKEALNIDGECTEALYNLGLTYKKMNNAEDALDSFYKALNLVRGNPLITYQIASVYEMLEDLDQAVEWYNNCLRVVPFDVHLHVKIADMYEKIGDMPLANQYRSDALRYFPSYMPLLFKVGHYFVENSLYEEAIKYFERASIVKPNDITWKLMIAWCLRHSGNMQESYEVYLQIVKKWPDDVNGLRHLVRTCHELGLTKEAAEYAVKLKRAERNLEARQKREALQEESLQGMSTGEELPPRSSRPGSLRSSSRTSRDSSASTFSGTPRQTSGRSIHSGHSSARTSAKVNSILEGGIDMDFSRPKLSHATDAINFQDSPRQSSGHSAKTDWENNFSKNSARSTSVKTPTYTTAAGSSNQQGRPKTARGSRDDFDDVDIAPDILPD